MEYKTLLPKSLKNIFQEENARGKLYVNVRQWKKGEQELLKNVQTEETIENRLPLLSDLWNVIWQRKKIAKN